jgi:hypothetical protein
MILRGATKHTASMGVYVHSEAPRSVRQGARGVACAAAGSRHSTHHTAMQPCMRDMPSWHGDPSEQRRVHKLVSGRLLAPLYPINGNL